MLAAMIISARRGDGHPGAAPENRALAQKNLADHVIRKCSATTAVEVSSRWKVRGRDSETPSRFSLCSAIGLTATRTGRLIAPGTDLVLRIDATPDFRQRARHF
jgi:hypothetical protein